MPKRHVFDIGVLVKFDLEGEVFAHVAQFGLNVCQLSNWDESLWTPENAALARQEAKQSDVRIAAVWAGYPGPAVWNFVEGPTTLGLVPSRYRRTRIRALKKAADFAHLVGAPAIVTHAGFIPENPRNAGYNGTLDAITEVAAYCLDRKVQFWFETGQETPVCLLRTIQDIGLPNLGINLDTANVILYGKANPVDSLEVYGQYVRCLHAKDGLYPTDGRALGKEVPIGKGWVDFKALFKKLRSLDYRGDIIIEREIHGDEQDRDIRKAIRYLAKALGGP